MLHLDTLMWEFPKIGDPNIVPLNSRILTIRTPQIRYPLFSETPMLRLRAEGFQPQRPGLPT